MNIFLCDDNAQERAYIKNLVLDWAAQSGALVSVCEYPSAEALLFDYPERCPDILLLDIEMPGMNGIELAKKLRAQAETAQIVFITGYPDFISEGYDVSALHYLLKPVFPDKLFEVLDRAYKAVCKGKPPETVVFRAGTETLRFKLSDIEYIAALGHSTVLLSGGRTYESKMSKMSIVHDNPQNSGAAFLFSVRLTFYPLKCRSCKISAFRAENIRSGKFYAILK